MEALKTEKIIIEGWNFQKENKNNRYTVNKLNSNIPMISLNISGLNTPIKRQRSAEWIKKMTQLYVVTSNIIT